MIRALVLDVDGVLVGEKIGFNSPNPNEEVISRLSNIKAAGIPVILCTGKPHYSVSAIIEGASLTNPHITNGGSVVINPIDNAILQQHTIPTQLALQILDACGKNNIYTEVYTVNAYYVLHAMQSRLTELHAHVLQQAPVLVDSLQEIARAHDVVKLMPIVKDESEIPAVERILAPFKDRISTAWGLHPVANPHQFCGITKQGISKEQMTIDVLNYVGVNPQDALGVGDSTSDWKYMQRTGFVAAMANAQDGLRSLVIQKGASGYIGGHVDENGILAIFDHFRLPPATPPPKA